MGDAPDTKRFRYVDVDGPGSGSSYYVCRSCGECFYTESWAAEKWNRCSVHDHKCWQNEGDYDFNGEARRLAVLDRSIGEHEEALRHVYALGVEQGRREAAEVLKELLRVTVAADEGLARASLDEYRKATDAAVSMLESLASPGE